MKYGLIVSACLVSITLFGQSVELPNYLNHAQAFWQNSQIDSATYYARREIAAAQQSQRWNEQAYALSWLGDVYRRGEQYDSAFYYLSRALMSVTSNPVADTTLAITHHQLGLYYEFQNQPEQALQMYQQALDLREQLDPAQPLAVATSYESLADVYRYIYYDYTQAEEYYLKVLTIYNQQKEISPKRMFSILYSLASTNSLKGDYEKALEFGFKTLAIAQSLGSVYQELCHHLLGTIFQSQGDGRRALSFYHEAIDLILAREGTRSQSLPRLYNNIGLAYLMTDSVEAAVQVFHQNLDVYTTIDAPALREDRADTYEYLGNAYTQDKQFDSASVYYQRSLRLYEQSGGKSRQLSETLVEVAEFHEGQQQYDSALHYYQRALVARVPGFDETDWQQSPSLAMMRNDPLVFGLIAKKAHALTTRYRRPEDVATLRMALASFLLADSLIDLCRGLYDRETAKLHFLEQNQSFYDQAIQCAYQLYQATDQANVISIAFSLIEKSKAMILWDALTDTQTKHSVGVPDSVLRRERQLKRQMAYISSLLIEVTSNESPDPQRLAQLRTEQYDLGQQQDALARTLAQQYPQYFDIKYERNKPLFALANAYATERNTTIIDYFWGKDHIYAVSTDAANTTFVSLPLTDSLAYDLATFQLSVQHRPSQNISQREFRAFTQVANRLYQRLLSSFLPHRTSPKRNFFDSFWQAQWENYPPSLTIIPDGPLSFLPFDCLLTRLPQDSSFSYKQLSYLLRSYSVGYAQSLRVLTQRADQSNQKRPAMRFLAFAYSDTDSIAPSPLRSPSPFQDLPGSASEIDALQRMAEGDVFKGAQATEHQFKATAKNHGIIHLAVHGQANSANPNNNRLIFRSESDSIEDGSLYSYELYELQLPADLTVLSTCESGTGKLQPGEGVYSLARGFAYAGCPSVMMSLWRVDDRQTSNLMPTFYRALFAGKTKVNALRDAKINYLQESSNYSAHPYFWAAFVLEGNASAIVNYQPARYVFWIVAVLTLVYLGFFLQKEWVKRNRKPDEMIRY